MRWLKIALLAIAVVSLAVTACDKYTIALVESTGSGTEAKATEIALLADIAQPTYTSYPTYTTYPSHTPDLTQTPYPTYTPRPTWTSYPSATPQASDIPGFTPTPYPTYTPYPTWTWYPSATRSPSHTPGPTWTRYPTYTPRPTYTRYPSPTPLPSPGVCNPSWRDPYALNLSIASSAKEAREILQSELLRWTRVVSLPAGKGGSIVRVYLTYLSPQVVEAIVIDQAMSNKLDAHKSREVAAEFDRRLQMRKAIPFLLTLRVGSELANPEWYSVELGPLAENMILVSQRQRHFSPLAEYTPALDLPTNLGAGGIEGFVLFPRSAGQDCNPTVDLLNDHSFDVRLEKIRLTYPLGGIEEVRGVWAYTLLPGIPLEQALRIPEPQRATEGIDLALILDIVGLAISFFELIVGS